jgi:WD40 repeat protein
MNVKLIATYKGHTANVTNLSVGILNSQIVSVSEDKTIKVWILQDF